MISVVICTHDPRPAYLKRVMDSLRAQTLRRDHWELIVVDNASAERLDRSLDLAWHPSARVVRENDLGLTPARLRGIRESTGDVLVFVDDDNVLSPDYLERVDEIASSRRFLGAWSGSVLPEFESTPPDWTRRYWGNLVIRDVKEDRWSNIYGLDETTPLGAGLCVRREVGLEYVRLHDEGLRTRKMDRVGKSLVSGGDNDLAECALDLGLATGVMSSLEVTHLIPNERLTEDYLLRLMENVAYSGVILRSLRPVAGNGVVATRLTTRVANFLRLARMTSRERRFHRAVSRGQTRARKELAAS